MRRLCDWVRTGGCGVFRLAFEDQTARRSGRRRRVRDERHQKTDPKSCLSPGLPL